MKFSLCLLTCNNLAQVTLGLPTLDIVLQRPDVHEMLIWDNGSTDQTVPWLKGFAADRPKVRLLLHEQNLGCGGARGQLFPQARGDFILSLDSDVQARVDFLSRLYQPFVSLKDVGVSGDHGANIRKGWDSVDNVPPQDGKPYQGYCDTVSGYCLLFSRKALEAGVSLNGDYGPYWLDDGELCFQIRQILGLRTYAQPCGVQHTWSKTNAGGMEDFCRAFGKFRNKWRKPYEAWNAKP